MPDGGSETLIPPYRAGPATLVTARSYLVDRFVPDCEIVHLPQKEVAGGRMRLSRGPVSAAVAPPKGLLRRMRQGGRRGVRRIDGRVIFDFRLRTPENWAHFLDNHLPIFFRSCETLGLDWDDALIVLPGAVPAYIPAAAALFGLEVLATDDTVEGEGVAFEVEPWTAVRAVRAAWARAPRVAEAVARATAGGASLPRRAFLDRRETRAIANGDEVRAFLAARGFEAVLPETLSPADQMRLFREAEAIVAIHGAALAPLLYVPPGGRLRQLVEILPVGHMTDVYRVMAEQVGVGWIGVRGRIKPAYVTPAYDLGSRFDAFSLDNFEVDVASLDLAFELTNGETRHG